MLEPDDIAHCNTRRAGQGSLNGRDEFGDRSTKTDDHDANNEMRQAEPQGQRPGATHQVLTAAQQEHESCQQTQGRDQQCPCTFRLICMKSAF
jgi:hypothetical protein